MPLPAEFAKLLRAVSLSLQPADQRNKHFNQPLEELHLKVISSLAIGIST